MANRLIVVDEETQEEVIITFFNWGKVMRNSQGENTFAVKNESMDYVAKNVTIKSIDSTPGTAEQIMFTLDSEVYVDTLSLGDIPPSGVSPLIIIRRVSKSTAVSGTYGVEVKAASWAVPNRDAQAEVNTDFESEGEIEGELL